MILQAGDHRVAGRDLRLETWDLGPIPTLSLTSSVAPGKQSTSELFFPTHKIQLLPRLLGSDQVGL